ncbi:MAG: hypothetical protein GY862_38650 [Gammaproteobacteria bacterium]|nr:hypothetical protein [Gammaproteobacteria bacterium]
MTLTINLTPELERRLMLEASRQNISVKKCTLQLLEKNLPPQDRQTILVSLLQSWIDDEENAIEQQETGEYLIHNLDEDRLSNRKLFPPELKDVTW